MNSLNANFTIRTAKPDDMPQVIKLIQELAEFEKMGDEVKLNAEDLKRDAFELEHPLFQCFVAEVCSEVVGYAIFYHKYSTWLGKAIFLEDLYVQPQHRGKTIGKSLFLTVAKCAYELGSRLDFEVLSWNPAMSFYKENFGAINITETENWQRCRLDIDALTKLFQ